MNASLNLPANELFEESELANSYKFLPLKDNFEPFSEYSLTASYENMHNVMSPASESYITDS